MEMDEKYRRDGEDGRGRAKVFTHQTAIVPQDFGMLMHSSRRGSSASNGMICNSNGYSISKSYSINSFNSQGFRCGTGNVGSGDYRVGPSEAIIDNNKCNSREDAKLHGASIQNVPMNGLKMKSEPCLPTGDINEEEGGGAGLVQSGLDSSRVKPQDSFKFLRMVPWMVVLGVASIMAAIGVASGEDWIAFLVISAQLLAVFFVIFLLYHWRRLYITLKTARRDILAGIRYGRIVYSIKKRQRNNQTLIDIFYENVKKHPNKICFYFEEEVWTFKDVDEASNRVGNYFLAQGLKKDDCVAIFLENRPLYCCYWLGLCKVGIVPALVNFNLRLQPLKHSLEVAKCKALIFGFELTEAVKEAMDLGFDRSSLDIFCCGKDKKDLLSGSVDLDQELSTVSCSRPEIEEKINFSDKLLYIYTSGTTGLPKAAVIKHSRFLFFITGVHYFVGLSPNDVIYDPLPMYHTAGGMIGVGQALVHGCTAVLRKKFSASSYFTDCIKYNCTTAQYIGELCRYLLSQPPKSHDKSHKVKLMFGNGLRPQIWETFATRFNIKRISEFYGSTEGNCNIVNIDNQVGAVGFISVTAPFIYPVTLIRIDEATGEPLRNPDTGLVLKCKTNQPGELVGKILKNHPGREFDGYADSTASNKKVVTDVFKKGDAAFRTGDVLVMDECGYFYFKDRTGDTFRWKGENCSTAEVEAVVSNACGLKDAVVYGVEIPGCDGRAGMAAILDPDETIDFEILGVRITKSLPSYARPLFIRIIKHLDMTGTYKMKKVDLQKEGFNIAKIEDKIYFLIGGKYILLDNELHEKICTGQLKL